MAASEARAVWQRMANRCIVQEDAKRAPKLACYPSSTSKLFPDAEAGTNPRRSDHPPSNLIPPCWNPTDACPVPPDTRWWLHVQPNLGVTYEQLDSSGEQDDVDQLTIDQDLDSSFGQTQKKCSAEEIPRIISASHVKHESGLMKDDDLVDWKTIDQLISMRSEKPMEPWWRIVDKDELALFVSKKSLEHFENCDLPQPQRIHFCADQFACLDCLDNHVLLTSSLDRFHAGTCYSPSELSISKTRLVAPGSDLSCRVRVPEAEKTEADPVRIDLLEALRRSQTRAREAEVAAQRAHMEKEHVINLFFKQASALFAYRQWVQMLQLESLFLRLKTKDQPFLSPWSTPLAGGPAAKKRRSLKQLTCRFCKCAVAVAVSVGLAAAGLLFGWTLGWLLPIF